MIDQIERRVVIDYTNYRNERKMYEIEPKSIFFGSNNWHHERQWLMAADVFRNDGKEVSSQSRTFAMCKIHQMWKASHD